MLLIWIFHSAASVGERWIFVVKTVKSEAYSLSLPPNSAENRDGKSLKWRLAERLIQLIKEVFNFLVYLILRAWRGERAVDFWRNNTGSEDFFQDFLLMFTNAWIFLLFRDFTLHEKFIWREEGERWWWSSRLSLRKLNLRWGRGKSIIKWGRVKW